MFEPRYHGEVRDPDTTPSQDLATPSSIFTWPDQYCATDPVAKLRFQVIHKLRACKTRTLTIDVHSLLSGW
jgi:hypothetical protein